MKRSIFARSCWLATFLAAAGLLAMSAAYAQQGLLDQIDTTYGDALWRVRGEYLYWWANGNLVPALVTTSPIGTPLNQAGVLGTPGVQTLYGNQNLDTGNRSGGRITLTRWFEDPQGPAFEFVGFYLSDDYQSGTFSAQSDGTTILSRPFFDPVSGQENAELVAYPNQLAGTVAVASYSEAYSAEGLLRQNIAADSSLRFDVLAGYRYFRYRETLTVREDLVSINPGGLIPLGTTTNLFDRFAVGNDFHGADLGASGVWTWGMASVEVLGKVAMGGIFRHSVVSGDTVVTVPAQPSTTTPGGLLALPTNIGSRSSSRFAVLPELNINGTLNITPRTTLIVGYTLILLNDALRSGHQIDRSVNTSQLGGQPLVGPALPAANFDASTLVLQGLNFGLDYRW